MIALVKAALAWIGGARSHITLLLLALAAAGLWIAFATIRHDRDELQAFAAHVCDAAGAGFGDDDGRACLARVRALVKREHDVDRASVRVLSDAVESIGRKSSADAAAARASADRAEQASATMEKANAAVGSDDRVGADWFRALNDVGGLQPARR
jgi:hypothetical protein